MTLLKLPKFSILISRLLFFFSDFVPPPTVLHRSICDVFWGLGGRSYTIIIQYGYQMKGYDFLHLVLVVLTLRGFAQATYRSNIKKIVVGKFKKKFQKKILLIKKLEIEKTKPTFIISVLKVVY